MLKTSKQPKQHVKQNRQLKTSRRSITKSRAILKSPITTSKYHHTTKAPLASAAFQTVSSTPVAEANEQANTVPLQHKSPELRFQSRNTYLKRRHTEKDHLIQTHHNDLRLLACNITNTLRESVKRHKMTLHEAELWGGYASAASLYAGLLRGQDRIIFEAFLNNKAQETSHVYVEAFAVGELRGFATLVNPDISKDNNTLLPSANGASRLTKVLHQYRRKFYSSVPATGDPMNDWNILYNQSEQLPTYLQTETIARQDEESGEIIIDFCGATLAQTLGGPAINPDEKARLLAEKPFKRKEDEGEDDDTYVKRMQLYEFRNKIVDSDFITTCQQYGAAGYIATLLGQNPDELGHPQNISNVGNISNEFDYELFERSLLVTNLRDKPLVNVHNTQTNNVITELPSIEEYKNSQKQQQQQQQGDSKLLESPIVPHTNVEENDNQSSEPIAPSASPKTSTHQFNMYYRPLQFFCRCFQTPPGEKLMSLPIDVLEDIVVDPEVTFTCDFCATPTTIPQKDIKQAIDNKQQMDQILAQKALEDEKNSHKPIEAIEEVHEHLHGDHKH